MAVDRPIPDYIQSLREERNGKQLIHIAIKIITHSDLDAQQCRLRLPISSESIMQRNLLALDQQAAANFLSIPEMESMIEINFLTEADKRRASDSEGVNVQVFVFRPGEPSWKQGQGELKKWKGNSIVIHGRDAQRAWSHLKEGHRVEVWAFKDEENKLYFAIRKLYMIL